MENTPKQPPTNSIVKRDFYGEDYQVRMVDEESRTIEGYAIVFNRESRLLGGWFVERILPEAVIGATENVDLRSEYNHETNFLLGRQSAGTATFTVDEIGYKYRVDVPKTYYGDTVIELTKRGDLKGASFQFMVAENGDTWETVKRGGKDVQLRTISKMEIVVEMGPVNEPAYLNTTNNMRVFESEKRSFDTWKNNQQPTTNNQQPKMTRSTLEAIIAEAELTA